MTPAPAFAIFGFGPKKSFMEKYPFMEKVLNGEAPVTENPTG